MRGVAVAIATAVGTGAVAGCAGEYPMTTFAPVTQFGARLNDLLSLVFWLTIGILVIVLGVLTFVIVRYRERPDGPPPRKIYGNNLAEILWTLGPAVIVAIMIVPTVQLIFETYQPPENGDEQLVVDVVGHQWWWEYQYDGLEIITANELHVPVDRPIELRLWTADVLHSWWVPRLGGKRDNFPRPTVVEEQAPNWHVLRFTIDEAGEYLGQCAEFCGTAHALMGTRVVAHEPEAFEAWVERFREPEAADLDPTDPAPAPELVAMAGDTARARELVASGYETFTSSTCVACHAVEGTTASGRVGPDLTGLGERWSIGAGTVDMTYDDLVRWITHPQSIKPGVLMPGTETEGGGFPPTGLSQEEVRAVAAYLLSLQ
ncbi:MAG: cytochrome c oxidase subunit II [Gemmatimonadota bacterium]